MARSPLLAQALEHHAELTQAHEEAAGISALLNKHLSQAFQIELSETKQPAINIAAALQRVARAERACGLCDRVNHTSGGIMKSNAVMAKFPLQISFRDGTLAPAAELWIRREAAKLENFYSRIMGCRVELASPHRHHHQGAPYHVRIDLTVPGGELVVKHEPSLRARARQSGERKLKKHFEIRAPHKQLRAAIDDAFKAAGRRLQDYSRRQRGDVKRLELPLVARVTQVFRNKDYGFLVTAEGRNVYFHKDSVLHNAFGRLKIGTLVCYAEEQGEKGPQATTVRIIGKQGPQSTPARVAA